MYQLDLQPANILRKAKTYIADVDHGTLVAIGSRKVREGVWRTGRNGRTLVEPTTGISTRATKSTATAETTTEATTADKSTTTSHGSTEAAAASHGTAEATTAAAGAAKATTTTSESILADFQGTTLPIIAVELRNSVPGIIRGLESNDTRALGASSGVGVHVSTNDGALLGCSRKYQVNSPSPRQNLDKVGMEGS